MIRRSEQEWEEIKPSIEQWYLNDGLVIREVCQMLGEEKNFVCSVRQIKSHLQKWGWRKKIDLETYMAMKAILKEYDDIIVFQVPLNNGKKIKKVKPSQVHKEVNRKKKTELPSIQRAIELLEQHYVCYIRGSTSRESQSPPPTVAESEDNGSTVSNSSISETANPDDGTREQNSQLRLFPDQIDTLPLMTTTLTYDGHRGNLTPDTVRILSNSDDLLHDLPGLLAKWNCVLDPANARIREWERFLELRLDKDSLQSDLDDSKRLPIEFAAYYVQQCLAGIESLDHIRHPDRQRARQNFAHMFRNSNARLLPKIFWISTVLEGHERLQLLSKFCDDCWDCVKEISSPAAYVFQSVILSMILKIRGMQKPLDEETLSLFSHAQRIQDLQSTFLKSINYLSSCIHGDSATTLILQSFYAWYLQQTGETDDIDRILFILLTYLPRSEKVMGEQHLVTIHYIYLIAQVYEKQGNLGCAESNIRIAICRLQSCPKPLRAYRYHILARLAELQMGQNDILAALSSFEEIFGFRQSNFGAYDPRTQIVAQIIFNIRKTQGWEARHREEDFPLL